MPRDKRILPSLPIRTHKSAGAIGLESLRGPAHGGAFLMAGGNLGVICMCGWIVTAKSQDGLEGGLKDHQVPKYCPSAASHAVALNPEDFSDLMS